MYFRIKSEFIGVLLIHEKTKTNSVCFLTQNQWKIYHKLEVSWIQECPPYIVQILPTEYYHTIVSSEFKGNTHGWKLNRNAIQPM